MIVNAREEAGIINPSTGYFLELDIFLPSLNLAFEYQVHSLINPRNLNSFSQEKHHFIKHTTFNKPLAEIKARDKMKQELANKAGITLISIPFWWDNRIER